MNDDENEKEGERERGEQGNIRRRRRTGTLQLKTQIVKFIVETQQ